MIGKRYTLDLSFARIQSLPVAPEAGETDPEQTFAGG